MKCIARYEYKIPRPYSIYFIPYPELNLTINNDNNLIMIWLRMNFAPVA